MTQENLIASYQRGDEAAISQLMEQYYSLALYVAQNILHNRQEAEEAVLDAFFSLWQQADKYDAQQASLKTWVLLFVRRRAIDRVRKTAAEPHLSLEEAFLFFELAPELEQAQQRWAIEDVMQALSAREQEVFYRRFFYMQSIAETAQEMDMSQDAVKSIVYRVRKRLQALEKGGNTDEGTR